ncbi:nectin-4 isoform X2 [Electrophorus electricus]|uniref:nectin-4 isoform X2 n=1 Tax=Electrophorus electricus TaxID=8005 RepID=UPI0015D05FBD|nr:nectin-4 isoform X2 [Electrophorus electricus]
MACLALFGVLLTRVIVCVCGEFIQPPPSLALRSFADEDSRLPCQFKAQDEDSVVQVTWYRERRGGVREHIITKHMTEGLQVFPGFAGRVRFESSDPIQDSTLLIQSTKESDQATYTCHISTYPSGNFERRIQLIVWRLPISSLDPVILEEGQAFRLAASCRAVGLPLPRLSWDTDVPGQSQNRTSGDGVVTSNFFLHPLRSMDGRRLDCLVWHPALDQPRRLRNTLVVHFPPDAVVAGYDHSWLVNNKGAELRCEGGGNPRPLNFTWTRKGAGLPEGVSVEGNRLIFTRPLNKTDEGVYQCEARNKVGVVRAEVNVEIPVTSEASQSQDSNNILLIIIVGGAAGTLVVVMVIIIILVNRYHKHKNRKLKRELSEKKEEINNLSRQNSMRRLNSISTDPRIQTEDCALIRLDSAMKNSLLTLEESSVLFEQREGLREGEYDSLGRPAIYPSCHSERGSGRRREMEAEKTERMRRVESFLKNSTLSMDLDLHRDQSPPPLSVSSGPLRQAGMEKVGWGQREGVTEGEEGNCTPEPYEISEALANHFHCSNGVLRPKPHPNAIILHPHGQII